MEGGRRIPKTRLEEEYGGPRGTNFLERLAQNNNSAQRPMQGVTGDGEQTLTSQIASERRSEREQFHTSSFLS